MIEFEFQAIVTDVRERFQKRYDPQKAGDAKTEGQMADAGEDVSIGWFVALAQYGIAIYFGKEKPEIEKGDTLVLLARKIQKDPPKLEVVPPPEPPPIDAETARKIWMMSLPANVAQRVTEAEAAARSEA